MTARIASLSAALLFGLTLIAGTAMAGDGKSCGGKKKDGESAAVIVPSMPNA
jgi:hypothetical protein